MLNAFTFSYAELILVLHFFFVLFVVLGGLLSLRTVAH